MKYTIKSNKLTVDISDKGAELSSVKTTDGFEYLWQADKAFWGAQAPVLFPLCGRILNGKYLYGGKEYFMNTHGFTRDSYFEVLSHTDSELVMEIKTSEETLKQYPFDFRLIAKYSVVDDTLTAEYTVENNGDVVMPYMFGAHPGLRLWGDEEISDFYLEFEGKDSVIWHPLQHGCFVNPNGQNYPLKNQTYPLNEEEIYAMDTIIFVGTGTKTALTSKKAERRVEMCWSDNFKYFCIWKMNKSEARYICLEPWSDVPGTGEVEEDFDTRKMSHLNPHSAENYQYKIKFS